MAARIGKETVTGKKATLRQDLDRLCEVFTEAEAKFDDPDERSMWLTENIFTKALSSKEGIELFKAIGPTEPGEKWLLFKNAAAKDGRPNWDCPAMRRIFPPVSETKTATETN